MGSHVEPWALRFLADFDRFLGGPMATALYLQSDPQAAAALSSVLDSKQSLTDSIAQDLQGVFDYTADETTDLQYTKGQSAAIAALQQQLGVSLLKAYETAVVVQYDVNCETVWSSSGIPATAALYGQAQLADQVKGVTFAAAKTSLDSESFLSFFATVDDPAHHSVVRGELDYAYYVRRVRYFQRGRPGWL